MSTWPSLRSKSVWFKALGYTPTDGQLPVHQSTARHILVGGGERAGKSRVTAMEALATFPRWDLCYIVGDTYDNCTPEFTYLSRYFHLLEEVTGSKIIMREKQPPSGQSRSSLDLKIHDQHKKIVTISTQRKGGDALSRKGEAPDIALLVEFAILGYDVYLAAVARVAEKRGRVILSGTFGDDSGWQAEMWRRWKGENEEGGQSFSIPTWSNDRIFPGGWDDPEIKRLRAIYAHAEFMRRFGAEPQRPATLVFGDFSFEKHVRDFVDYDPGLPVELAIDPGYGESSYAVLAIQTAGNIVFVFDEIHIQGHTGEEVIALARKKWKWFDRVKGGVIDFAGRQHHAARSQVEVWQGEAGIYLRNQQVPLEAGRLRLQSFLLPDPLTKMPRIFFSPRCKKTCAEFTKYVWRNTPEERLGNAKPIDRHCDSIKALIYTLVDHFGYVEWPKIHIPYKTPREELWRKAYKMG